jgi:biotin transport system substrate-specific component
VKEKKFTVYQLCFMALMAAVTCILAPLSIPIGPIPISLTNLVVYFTVYVIGLIAGPTGGYIVGFVLMALIGGYVIEKTNRNMVLVIIAWIVGTMVDYALGTAWFAYVQHCTVGYALKVCVYPFIVFDLIKIVAATFLKSYLKANQVVVILRKELFQNREIRRFLMK